jgi:hypothetical protein
MLDADQRSACERGHTVLGVSGRLLTGRSPARFRAGPRPGRAARFRAARLWAEPPACRAGPLASGPGRSPLGRADRLWAEPRPGPPACRAARLWAGRPPRPTKIAHARQRRDRLARFPLPSGETRPRARPTGDACGTIIGDSFDLDRGSRAGRVRFGADGDQDPPRSRCAARAWSKLIARVGGASRVLGVSQAPHSSPRHSSPRRRARGSPLTTRS